MQPPTGRQAPQGPYQNPSFGPHSPAQPQFGTPPPKRTSKTWAIVAGAVALVAVIATVLIVVLTRDDDEAPSENPSAGGLTCAPGDMGIKVDPKTGESITCEGSTPGPGAGGSAGSPGEGSGGGGQISTDEPDFLAGSWKVELTEGNYGGTAPLESEKLIDPDRPSQMTWTIDGDCATLSGCTLSLDMGDGTVVPLTHDPGKGAFFGGIPTAATCAAGPSTAKLQVGIYDFSAGEFVRGYVHTYATAPCYANNYTQSAQLYPA